MDQVFCIWGNDIWITIKNKMRTAYAMRNPFQMRESILPEQLSARIAAWDLSHPGKSLFMSFSSTAADSSKRRQLAACVNILKRFNLPQSHWDTESIKIITYFVFNSEPSLELVKHARSLIITLLRILCNFFSFFIISDHWIFSLCLCGSVVIKADRLLDLETYPTCSLTWKNKNPYHLSTVRILKTRLKCSTDGCGTQEK